MNNSQPTSYLLPDLMIDLLIPFEADSPELETDQLLAQELLADLLPSASQRKN